ncbi:MAG: hypothetical protein PUG83_05550 [Clostridiaceae bacterium]|nr:hypothetical protein [Clostridiaceae bacterium]MDY5991902.1 hypothetical protein [Oscillospiraceae bacterium]
MKTLSCVKFFMCLLKCNKILCLVKKATVLMLGAVMVCAAVCCLADNKKSVKKCIAKLRAVM